LKNTYINRSPITGIGPRLLLTADQRKSVLHQHTVKEEEGVCLAVMLLLVFVLLCFWFLLHLQYDVAAVELRRSEYS